jgi:hypothetical protein
MSIKEGNADVVFEQQYTNKETNVRISTSEVLPKDIFFGYDTNGFNCKKFSINLIYIYTNS